MGADAETPWLRAEGLTKLYGGVLALEDATLEIRRGEVRGLVGQNGAGKSTLVKILTGLVAPTAGSVSVDGAPLRLGLPKESLRAGIVAVPQELTVAPSMTVAENIMMGHYPAWRAGFMREGAMRAAAAEVLETLSLGIAPDAVVGHLPLIRQRLVMVARALSFEPRLMIFDEPTATISPQEVELILEAIRLLSSRGVAILYVSHRLDEIDTICSGVTVIRDGRVVADLTASEATHAALVEHLVAGSGQGASAAPGHPRAKTVSDRAVLELDGVTGEWIRDISLTVHEGEVVGIAGLAGAGTREVLLTICGALPFSSGSIRLEGDAIRSGYAPAAISSGVGFLPGDRSLAAFPSHSIRHNVSVAALRMFARGPFVDVGKEKTAVSAFLERVALRRDPELQISTLSGGNQQKAMVARWLAAGSRLLLLDDPTAGVDVATRPEIHAQIRAACAAGAAVLLVSTDIDELVELADRLVVLERGRVKRELAGADLTAPAVLDAMTRQDAAAPARAEA